MKQVLGRKQTSKNEDWIWAFKHIEELITREEVETYAKASLDEMRQATAGKRVAYAYSAGKDSIVLAHLCEKVALTTGFFAYCDLDYPAFIAWVRENKPQGVQMMHTGIGLNWLARHQDLIFAEGQLGQRWHQISQRGPFTRMFFENRLDLLLVGHRRIDGNFCGPNGYIKKRSGETRYAPIRDWPHEALLGYIHYNNLPLPPIYGWKDGWVQGTHAWPEREFCSDDIMRGYQEVYDIDPEIVIKASKKLSSACHFLEEVGA
ncbi:MAG: phosphoadenosine phosphosulfate reductase family protein [Clostridium sp.]|nr:phosphoadenosine phosphosulfate reductase family protein [Clostridium sp.]